MRQQYHRYTEAQIKFLKEIYPGRCLAEITKLFNRRFRLSLSPCSLATAARKRGIKSGYKHRSSWNKAFFDKHVKFLRKIVPGRHWPEIAKLFNSHFGLSVTEEQIQNLCQRVGGIRTGFTGQFQKGCTPPNKGKKGYCAPGSEKGWFPKGNIPWDYRPVGSERVNADGYMQIKVSDTALPVSKRWKMKHIMVWEEANGKVPPGYFVVFLDKNSLNVSLDNLYMISQKAHAVMCHKNWYTEDKDLTKTYCIMAEIKVAVAGHKKKSLDVVDNEKMMIIDNRDNLIVIAEMTGKKKFIAARKTEKGLQILKANLKPRNSKEAAQRDLCEYARKRGWQRV